MQDILEQATTFIQQFYSEMRRTGQTARLEEIAAEIRRTGTYTHTYDELVYGAKVAWRNSNRCIGRLFWNSLKVRDYRHIETAQELFEALEAHLDFATNGGKIRSTISIFPQKNTSTDTHWRIHNYSVLQYAGYAHPTRGQLGDPKHLHFTQQAQRLGWQSGTPSNFDILPVLIQNGNRPVQWFEFDPTAVLEVSIEHPTLTHLSQMNLKWYAVPIISNMILRIGGVEYTAAPFNGWYMLNEIACRNFADVDRYNLLPVIAQNMGLDTGQRVSLWKDRALLELNEAVLYSFTKAGVSLVDHHSAAEQFMQFNELENKRNREVTADWAWIAPPMSSSTTPVYHQSWEDKMIDPNYYYRQEELHIATDKTPSACPFSGKHHLR